MCLVVFTRCFVFCVILIAFSVCPGVLALQVAILCNHQRSVPKTHEASMAKATEKLNAMREEVKELEEQHSKALRGRGGNPDA